MKKRIVRTAEVTIETEEKTLLRPSPGLRQDPHSALLWCRACRREVEMVTPEQAAQIAGVSQRTIYRWVEAHHIHFREEREHLFICYPALSRNRSILERSTT